MTRTCQGHARPHHRGLALSSGFQCRISNELNDPCNIIGGSGGAFTHPWSVPKVAVKDGQKKKKRRLGPWPFFLWGTSWWLRCLREGLAQHSISTIPAVERFSINSWCIIKAYIARLPHQIKVDKRWPFWQSLLLGQEAFQYLVLYYLKWYVW